MRLPVAFLAACMLATGTLNTISTKIQDTVVVGEDAHGRPQTFKHPVVQTACMFGGECLCLVLFLLGRLYRRAARPAPAEAASPAAAATASKRLGRTVWVFALPALCDSGATTLLNLGLFYTYASVFQMLRGTLVVFAGGLTIVMLKRRLHVHHWLGMVLICVGAALVGASSLLFKDPAPGGGGRFSALAGILFSSSGRGGASAAPNPLLGNVLVILAQMLNAMQFILEEKYLVQYRAPVLLAVGLEGAWGLVIIALATPFLSQIRGPDGLPLDSFGEAFAQIRGNSTLQWTTAATVLSIGFFNFFGVSVTKKLSGAARATIDACRTLFVWFFCLWAGWEHFHLLQVVGFFILLSGTSTYNEILRSCMPAQAPSLPQHRRHHRSSGAGGEEEGAQEPLLGRDGSGKRPPPRAGGREEDAGSLGFSFAPDGAQQHEEQQQYLPPRAARPPLPARPRPVSSHMSMARSVTILPGVLSPRSLASPSIGFESLGTNGEALGSSSEEEESSGSGGSDSEVDLPPGAGEQRGLPETRDRRASG